MSSRTLTLYVPASNLIAAESNLRTNKIYNSAEAAWAEADKQREKHGYSWIVWKVVVTEMTLDEK